MLLLVMCFTFITLYILITSFSAIFINYYILYGVKNLTYLLKWPEVVFKNNKLFRISLVKCI